MSRCRLKGTLAASSAYTGRSAFVDDVSRAVAKANGDPEFLGGVMQIDEKLWISKQVGLREGLAEGEAKGKAEGLAEGKAAGAADSQRKISELARRMAAEGRQDDLVATLTDDSRLEEELRRYGIE